MSLANSCLISCFRFRKIPWLYCEVDNYVRKQILMCYNPWTKDIFFISLIKSFIFTKGFCLKGKSMVMVPPVSWGPIYLLRGWVRGRKWYVWHGLLLSADFFTLCNCLQKYWQSATALTVCNFLDSFQLYWQYFIVWIGLHFCRNVFPQGTIKL